MGKAIAILVVGICLGIIGSQIHFSSQQDANHFGEITRLTIHSYQFQTGKAKEAASSISGLLWSEYEVIRNPNIKQAAAKAMIGYHQTLGISLPDYYKFDPAIPENNDCKTYFISMLSTMAHSRAGAQSSR